MKKNYRIIGFCLAILMLFGNVPAVSAAAAAGAGAAGGENALNADIVNEESFRAGYTDVTSLYDVTELFKKYYNPDLVSSNNLETDKEYTLIVQLDGFNLTQYWELEGRRGDLDEYIGSAAGQAHAEEIAKDIRAYLSELDAQGIAYECVWTYNTVLKAVALKVAGADANAVAATKGATVASVSTHYDAPKVEEIENNVNVYSTGIYNTSGIDQSLRGEGTLIAVLDTGLDYTHAAFQEDNFYADRDKVALTYDGLVQILADREFQAETTTSGLTADDVYISVKVPYAYDYADKDADVFPSYSYHGAHVAGIIAGNYTEIPAGSIWLDDEDLVFVEQLDGEGNPTGNYYFEGVAPDAQLAIMKVFTDDVDDEALGGAETENILRALDDCAKLGVDVINMSLGSSAGFSSYADDIENIVMSEVYTAIYTAGISLVCAASNDYSSGYGGVNGTNLTSNPDSATVGSPSTYPAAISVASIDGRKSPYLLGNRGSENETMVFFTESSDGNSNKRDFLKQMFEKAGLDLAADTLEVGYVVIGGVGRSYNYSIVRSKIQNLKNQGKLVVALVQRGDTSFEEKMVCAMEAECDAILIRNNVAGSITMTMGKTDEAEMIPAASISMDIGQELVDRAVNGVGTLTLNSGYAAGPFMSDFSSWGPTPSLRLKPEITSYGGNVTSSVTGGYDVYSGTSMATPNLAGACAIIRTYLKRLYPEATANELSARTYQLLMSTAKIALNEYGDPYSPRKQGAGIADIESVLRAVTYAWTKTESGAVSDKTKLELGDDPQKNGVYRMTYYVSNTGSDAVTYVLGEYVMTEKVSSDGLTVAERSYLFHDYDVRYEVSAYGDSSVDYRDRQRLLTLQEGATAEVTVTLTLSDADKSYLDTYFANGMYVEGFLTLTARDGTDIDLSIPYLAFYGDWTDAPMMDWSVFELADIEQDDSIPDDEKEKISFFATAPYAKYGKDYIIPMGQYVYTMSDDMTKVYADTEHAAVSMYSDPDGHYTTYNFYAVYAGLLRGAKVCNFTITDAYTGEVIYEKELRNVSKGYARGGSARPGYISVEFNPYELGLPNNGKYRFEMEAYLDYGDGTKGNKNSFEFEFYTDYESPVLNDVEVRYVTQKENEKEVTHIYLDIYTYDNHYTQALLLCYVDEESNSLELATEYVTPVYGTTMGAITKTTIEITDLYEKYFDNLYLQVEDYAMNYTVYQLDLSDEMTFPATITFDESSVTLMQNEACKPGFTFTPDDVQTYDLIWKSMDESVAIVRDGEIFGVSEGTTYVYVYAAKESTLAVPRARIRVNVTAEKKTERVAFQSMTLELITDRKRRPVDPTNATVEVRPNADYQLAVVKNPWYAADAEITWSTSNPLVATVDENGLVHTLKEGTTTIVAESGVCSTYVRMTVSAEYIITSYILTDYYGAGGDVVVPEKYNFSYIDEEVFMDNQDITSIVIPDGVTEIYKDAFKNCKNLKKVVLPDTLTYIHESAFEGCTALEELDMSRCLSLIVGKRCFFGCSSLERIVSDDRGCRIVAAWDYAFAGCSSLISYDAQNLCIVGDYVFSDCTGLETVNLTQYTTVGKGMFYNCASLRTLTVPVSEIGANAFGGCNGLMDLTFTAEKTRIGESAFAECTKLTRIVFTGSTYEIADRAFAGCRALTVLDLPDGEVSLGEAAFRGCTALSRIRISQDTKISLTGSAPFEECTSFAYFSAIRTLPTTGETVVVSSGKTRNYQIVDNILYSLDGTELVLIPSSRDITGFVLGSGVTSIGDNAFCGHMELTSMDLSGIEHIGMYAFEKTGLAGTLTIPASVSSIGDGAFYYCLDLEKVEFAADSALTEIPARCFSHAAKLTTVRLPATVTHIGPYAFSESALNALTAVGESAVAGFFDGAAFGALRSIGGAAFAETLFTEAELPNTLKRVGNAAFGYCPRLETVVFLDGVSDLSLGEGLFYDSMSLNTVVFPEGLSAIGAYTFAGKVERRELTTVILPATLISMGEGAFYENMGLTSLNLGDTGVRELAPYTFYGCENLEEIDLTKIEVFGTASFAFNKAMATIDLSGATVIGDRAFYGVGAAEVLIPNVRSIGMEAFMESGLRTITLPSTLNYIGHGAISYNFYLTEIRMPVSAGKYFVDFLRDKDGTLLDYGVLYSVLDNGAYQVECFPGGLEWPSYTVLDGTVRIGVEAFEGVLGLDEVHLPASLRVIGSKAFYDTYLKNYYFQSVNAPILECDFIDAEAYDSEDWVYQVFSRNGGAGLEQYYANFFYYSAYAAYTNSDFGLVLNFPINGYGYDSPVWNDFFHGGIYMDEVADNTTLDAISAISALLSPEEIATLGETDFRSYLTIVKRARNLFNAVLPGRQTEYITGDYNETDYEALLLAVESVVREKRAEYGMGNPVSYLRIVTPPEKLIYTERENFETAGMVVKAIYEDGSQVVLDSYTLESNVAARGTKYLTVKALGLQVSVAVTVKDSTVPFAIEAAAETETLISSLSALLGAEQIAALSAEELTEYATFVSDLRQQYNGMESAEQRSLLSGAYNGVDYVEKLNACEAQLRAAKNAAGIANPVVALQIVKAPLKTVYTEGEALATDGMVVVVVYADGSSEEVSAYTLETALADPENAALTVSYGGMAVSMPITVTAKESGGGIALWVVLLSVGGVLTALGGAGMVWFFLRKKKN